MNKPTIIVITGRSGRSRKRFGNGKTIDHMIKKIAGTEFNQKIFYSSDGRRKNIRAIKKTIRKTDGDIYLIGKSAGGIRAHQLVAKLPASDKLKLAGVCLVDPNGIYWGDGRCGWYGMTLFELSSMRVSCPQVCIYQRNSTLKGASLCGQENHDMTAIGADHWNITDIDSPVGKEVARLIKNFLGIEWHVPRRYPCKKKR